MIFQQWDDYLTVDLVEGFINWVVTEKAARKVLGREAAFELCRDVSDWLKPKEGTPGRKDWVSKVNWRAAQRIDPDLTKRSGFQWEPMNKEIRGEMESASLMVKSAAKLEEILGPSPDPINNLHT